MEPIEKKVHYFGKPGKPNTEALLKIVKEYITKEKIENVVVAHVRYRLEQDGVWTAVAQKRHPVADVREITPSNIPNSRSIVVKPVEHLKRS